VKSLAGKKVKFQVKVHQVEEAIVPEITETWIEKTFGKKITITHWKEDITKQIQENHEQECKREQEEAFLKELLTVISADIPVTLLSFEKSGMLQEIKTNLERSGLSYEQYLKAVKKTEEEVLNDFEKPAEERLKLRFGLQEIAKQEGVDFAKILEKLLESM
jgi:trigger factor